MSAATDRIESAYRIGVIIIAIFLAGAAFSGWLKTPSRVTAVEQQIDTLNQQHEHIKDEFSALRRSLDLILCLEIADRNKVDWRQHCKDAVVR